MRLNGFLTRPPDSRKKRLCSLPKSATSWASGAETVGTDAGQAATFDPPFPQTTT